MVLDIRKELRERKAGHPITASIGTARSRNADLYLKADRRAEIIIGDEAESIAGPCSPPTPVYSRKLDHLQPLYEPACEKPRPPQPRPLRIPCSACTFVPAPHTHHNLQHNIDLALGQLSQIHAGGMRARSHRAKMNSGKQRHKAASSHAPTDDVVEPGAEESVEIEEPGVEDIAGGHGGCHSLQEKTPSLSTHHFNASFGSSIEPIRVACSACTSSLMAPFSYGQHPRCDRITPLAKPKFLRKKQDKRQLADSIVFSSPSAVEDIANTACGRSEALKNNDRQDLVEPLTTSDMESSRGWYVRPEQDTYIIRKSIPAASDYAKATIEEYISHSNLEDVVEAVEGANQHESLELTYQSTRDREEIRQQFRPADSVKHRSERNDIVAAAGHNCFVKRVERACASAARSASAGSKGRAPSSPAARWPRQHDNSRHMFYADYRRPTSPSTNRLNRRRRPSSADRDPTLGSCNRDKDAASAPASPMNEAEDRTAFAHTPHRTMQFGEAPTVAGHDAAENIVQALAVSHDDASISCMQDHTIFRKELQRRHYPPYRPQKKKLIVNRSMKANGSKYARHVSVAGTGDVDNELVAARSVGGQAKQPLEGHGSDQETMSTPSGRGRSDKGNNDLYYSSKQGAVRDRGSLSRSTAGGGRVPGISESSKEGRTAAPAGAGADDIGGGHIEEVARVGACSMSSSPRNSSDSKMQQQQQELKLSVEVFPSPSASKGFGLKITQHFPKAPVQVEYVNSLGLSPRSFQTLHCQRCITSSSSSTTPG
ncbi:hypothetical protein GOP47_0011730 [Adiantum capillus-veneris]|uniref:Uncharacterized protein n=1 Tax=Adiantum capillus-veneris TaxID=13818 RepID=A0A9D4ZH14_ADICA|nr:hypothetical protein GOP47_0011730 [Adiantum capillus-veneris]